MRRPGLEPLAPARDAEIGIEALNHGADAVYIGGTAFGARIFLTLNTILRDDELEDARRLAWEAWNIGIDALIEAGIRSVKIEGRYKDMGTVKDVTAHYRQRLDALLEQRPELARASAGQCRYTFRPDPGLSYNRGGIDYFVNGRQDDIGAFDTPKHAGLPLGHVARTAREHFEIELDEGDAALHNGDALTWVDLQGELQGVPVNVATPLGGRAWRARSRCRSNRCSFPPRSPTACAARRRSSRRRPIRTTR